MTQEGDRGIDRRGGGRREVDIRNEVVGTRKWGPVNQNPEPQVGRRK